MSPLGSLRLCFTQLHSIAWQFVTLAWAFLFAAAFANHIIQVEDEENQTLAKFLVVTLTVTIPSMMINKALFYLHGCPCLLTKYKQIGAAWRRAACLASFGDCLSFGCGCVAMLLFLLGIMFSTLHDICLVDCGTTNSTNATISNSGADSDIEPGDGSWALWWVFSRCQSYLLSVVFALYYFAPFEWAVCLADHVACTFGLARWKIEHRKVRLQLEKYAKDAQLFEGG